MVIALMMGVMFWVLAANDERGDLDQVAAGEGQAAAAPAQPAPKPKPKPKPKPIAVPPAPAQTELTSNDWLLARYALVKEGGNLTVTGSVQNLSEQQRSATLHVFVYADGKHIATGSGDVRGVQSGGRVQVSLPSGTKWRAGDVILLQADNL